MVQSQVPHICVANPQCQSYQHRCFDNRLRGDVCICIPSTTDPASSPAEIQPDAELHSAANGPILAILELISGPPDSCQGGPLFL